MPTQRDEYKDDHRKVITLGNDHIKWDELKDIDLLNILQRLVAKKLRIDEPKKEDYLNVPVGFIECFLYIEELFPDENVNDMLFKKLTEEVNEGYIEVNNKAEYGTSKFTMSLKQLRDIKPMDIGFVKKCFTTNAFLAYTTERAQVGENFDTEEEAREALRRVSRHDISVNSSLSLFLSLSLSFPITNNNPLLFAR